MKLTLLMTIFLLSSCGKINLPKDSKLATLNSLTSMPMVVGSSEHSKIKEICDALQTKTLTISALVNTDYIFSNTTKQCSDTSFSPMADANVKMVNQSGSLKFSEGNNLFYFSDVETIDTGVLGFICQRLDNLASPIALDATNLLYFTASDFISTDCQNEPTQRCLKIELLTNQVGAAQKKTTVPIVAKTKSVLLVLVLRNRMSMIPLLTPSC